LKPSKLTVTSWISRTLVLIVGGWEWVLGRVGTAHHGTMELIEVYGSARLIGVIF